MIHHQIHNNADKDFTIAVYQTLTEIDQKTQISAFGKIQTYVLVTIFLLLLQLGHLIKPFAYGFFRLLSLVSYLLVPVLISYIFGIMGRPVHGVTDNILFVFNAPTIDTLRYLTCVWAVFLMFAFAGFDNLNAFSLEERHDRSKLVIQLAIQFSLLFLIVYQIPSKTNVVAIVGLLLVLTFKFVGRLFALAHSAGATPRIKKDVSRIINYMNRGDTKTMVGFDYLVGPRYTKLEDGRIVDGITMDKILDSQGRIMGLEDTSNMELKDTCLSFALFWLLLGKFLSYPLYSKKSSSRDNAWRMVRHGLLAKKGDHERVFRVIEIELAFLRDYFHAKYIFFYLNGFYWKLFSVVALPVMFWWFIQKSINKDELEKLTNDGYGHFTFTRVANTIVISVIVALEAIQLVVFLASRWLKVTLICFYVKKMSSKNTGFLSSYILEVLGFVFLGVSRSSNSAWWRKPWKRELDQYLLIQSCTTLIKPISYLKLQFISILGIPLSKPDIKQGKKVVLSEQVKKAVVLCLQRNKAYPNLTNGTESLRRNGGLEMLPGWACKLKNDTETILVWHIATSVCELQHELSSPQSSNVGDDMKVATELSRYCAYLLFFSPFLVPVPSLGAEIICDTVIEEAIALFKRPIFAWGEEENVVKYDKLMDLAKANEEAGDQGSHMSVLKKGAKLGYDLVTLVDDKEKRWRILAELWAEMILYLAPSNNNELEHAGKLSQGGEFITQLWALLIHAGIYNRDDMEVAFKKADAN